MEYRQTETIKYFFRQTSTDIYMNIWCSLLMNNRYLMIIPGDHLLFISSSCHVCLSLFSSPLLLSSSTPLLSSSSFLLFSLLLLFHLCSLLCSSSTTKATRLFEVNITRLSTETWLGHSKFQIPNHQELPLSELWFKRTWSDISGYCVLDMLGRTLLGHFPPCPQRAHTEWNEFVRPSDSRPFSFRSVRISARGSRERGGQVLKHQRARRVSAKNRNKKRREWTQRVLYRSSYPES